MINASGIEVKLSQAQQRAYDKLTNKFQSAYDLQEYLNTLDILVSKGLADSFKGFAAFFFPRGGWLYKRNKV